MKYFIKKLLNILKNNPVNFPSINELKELKALKRKNEISKDFRQYVAYLNRKQIKWLRETHKTYD
tara:strand:- start:600 stop:794 length:195 start_codon:yes stop_codon:yes gene_type:complete